MQFSEDLHLSEHIENCLKDIPSRPGVYLMKVAPETVIYVGKAKNLRTRVRSYFKNSSDTNLKAQMLRSNTSDIEWIITDTEKEALILESNLIKKYHPKYNIVLKDDKSYPYLRLSWSEEYPRLSICRRLKNDGSSYFGPYVSVKAARETWRLIHRLFPIRKCQTKGFPKRKRPCINHQMDLCPAPCCNFVDPNEYRKVVRDVQLFLQGKKQELIREMKVRMEQESQNLNFEVAAKIRDQIRALEKTLEPQKVASPANANQDVIGYARRDKQVKIVVLFIREGNLVGSKNFSLKAFELIKDQEVITSFINQFYHSDKFLPEKIIVPFEIDSKKVTESWLSERKGGKVKIIVPKKGSYLELLRMAEENASGLLKCEKETPSMEDILNDLKEKLHLSRIPISIECYDCSNLKGRFAVASMVRFERGEPRKEFYRRFRIRTLEEIDDYGMIREVLMRRFMQGRSKDDLPDLVMIDGGKGHLQVALKVLEDLQVKGIDVIALAKGERCQEGKKDKIFLPHRKNPLLLKPGSELLLLLQRIRDESHRFAIKYHHLLKKKIEFHSILDEIPGIGEKIKKRLLTHFGSVEGIRRAAIEEIASLQGLNFAKAEIILNYLKNTEN